MPTGRRAITHPVILYMPLEICSMMMGSVESFGKVAARPSPKSIANVSIPKMLLLDKAENGFSNILSSKLVSTAMTVPSFSAKNRISLPASNSIGVISPHGFNASTMVKPINIAMPVVLT